MANKHKADVREADEAVRAWFPFAGKWIILIVVIVLLVGGGISFGVTYASRWHKSLQREATQRSQGYTESKAAILYDLYNEWLRLDAEIIMLKEEGASPEVINADIAARNAALNQLKFEVSMIPQSEVPPEIWDFISTH